MNCKELKYKINGQAKNIIESGLGLKKNGQCPYGDHKKGYSNGYKWIDDHFFCFDCNRSYDIIDYAKETFGSDWFVKLHELAGVSFEVKKMQPINAVCRSRTNDGIEYLKSRGISEEVIKKYLVTCSNSHVYFNYLLPDGKTLIATKHRDFKTSEKSKRFQATKGSQPYLYGMHLLKKQKVMLITEGEVDALSFAEISKHKSEDFFCTSIPNGANSFKAVFENCKSYFDLFEKIIIVPDNDSAGKAFRDTASDLLSEYELGEIILPCKDLNEYLMSDEYDNKQIFNYLHAIVPKTSFVTADNIGTNVKYKAWESGFWQIDNALAGLQAKWVTILYGSEGSGKTTLARQSLLAFAMQGVKSAMYVGEGQWEVERDKLARLVYGRKAIQKRTEAIASADRWDTTPEARDKFLDEYGDKIFFLDQYGLANVGGTDEPFEFLCKEIGKLVKHGVKLIVLDSLTKLLPSKKMDNLKMQSYIPEQLKHLATVYGIHIILIHHTNKAGGMEGVQAIRRFVDVVIGYGRIKNLDDIPSEFDCVKPYNPTSIASVEKVRDDGDYIMTLFAFDKDTSRVYNLCSDIRSNEYVEKNYWTVNVHRIQDENVPEYRDPYKN